MALNNVPLSGQTLGDTLNPINQNFSLINAAFLVDHVEYNTANQGKHNKVTFPLQAASPATAATEVALFSQTSAITSLVELAFRRQSNGSVYEFTGSLAAANGWTRLPSGILIKWGSTIANLPNPITITFPVAANIPVFSAIYTVLPVTSNVGPNFVDNYIRLIDFNTTQFRVWSSTFSGGNTSGALQYIAIGS